MPLSKHKRKIFFLQRSGIGYLSKMDSIVISMRGERKKPALSKLMIVSLIEASVKQNRGIPFGPVDIKGSIGALIRRELVVLKDVTVKNQIQSHWQVTPEAFEILKKLGVNLDNYS